MGNIDLFNERFGLHDPREIRGAHATINDRTGDAESSGINPSPSEMFRSLAGKLLDDQFELRKFLAGKPLPEDRQEVAAFLRKQRQVAFCAAHIPRKDHRSPCNPLF